MSDAMAEIRASFFIECEELLEALQEGLQQIEDGSGDDETINVVFRAVHSIKGGAGAFGLDGVVSFAHAFETALDEVRNGNLVPDSASMLLFFQCGDSLSDLVRAARDEIELDASATAPLLAQLAELTGIEAEEEEEIDPSEFEAQTLSLDLMDLGMDGDLPGLPPLTPATETFRIRFAPQPELYSTGSEPLHLFRALSKLGALSVTVERAELSDLAAFTLPAATLQWNLTLETVEGRGAIEEIFEFVEGFCTLEIEAKQDLDDPSDTVVAETAADPSPEPNDATPVEPEPVEQPPSTTEASEDPPAKPAKKPATQTASKGPSPTVRVDLDRIDRLVNLVGELVINQAMLAQSLNAAGVAGNTNIATGLDEFQQLTRDIQDSVMMIRAQPVKSLFQRMGRIVRESSAAVGKTVRLVTLGESTEIDKTVIERLADPLTHMIRNAVDHGLEATDTRIAAGKPTEGKVTLEASHKSGRVIIEVADDGGGINRSKVKQIAIDKGLIPADAELTDSEIDNLLFLPGFSTASEVSNLSGRGVGMDVVKNAITSLGGRIAITSHPGEGTSFAISLPLTLAVLDGMVVRVGKETLVVPLSTISETLSLAETDTKRLGPNTQVVLVRDVYVPLIDLGAELGYSAARADYSDAIVLLISQEDGSRAALVVDEIDDQRQVVIKGLSDSYGHVPGVAAATILGDGQIALILDPVDLLAHATGISHPGASPTASLAETG